MSSPLRCCFALLAACILSGWSVAARAQDAVAISGSIGATSDFVFRGLSYTRGGPAAQASLDLEVDAGVYAGGFVSSTNPNPGASPPAEVDLWLGLQRVLNEWLSADLRYVHYMYPDDPRVADYDRDELTATLGVKRAVFLAVTYSPNTEAIASVPGASRGDAWAVEVLAQHRLSARWSISAGGGRYFLDEIYAEDYDYWGATLSLDLTPVEIHFAVLGADSAAERIFTSRIAGERIAVTALYRFAVTR